MSVLPLLLAASCALSAVNVKDFGAQRAEPEEYIDITTKTNHWDLSDYMDATKERNDEYLAVAQAGDDIVIMRRKA